MIPIRTIRWSECLWKINRARRKDLCYSHRNFSRAAATTWVSSKALRAENTYHIYHSSHRLWSSNPHAFVPLSIPRFASTNSQSPTSLDASPTSSPEVATPPIGEPVASNIDDVIFNDLPAVTEHIGYLKELGLDYGWGPTAFVETLLEHVHVYSGLPWWGSILLTALVVRVALFKLFVNASDTSARVAILAPLVKPIKDRISAAQATKDIAAVKLASAEMAGLYKNAGVQVYKMFFPLIQVPIGYGTFRLLRGMSALPVPGLEDGGLLWLKDLTVADPYFILPVMTGLAFHWTFKGGGETGSSTVMSPAMQAVMKYVIPAFSTLCMLGMPGSLQLTFGFTSCLSLIQMYFLRQPWFRSFLNIQPLVPPTASPSPSTSSYAGTVTRYQPPSPTAAIPSPPGPTGIIDGAISDIKGAASQVMKSAKTLQAKAAGESKNPAGRRTEAELRKASAYEERRQRELVHEKAEIKHAKKERKRERKQAGG